MCLCPAKPKEIFIFTQTNESEVEYESTLDFNYINSDLWTDTERRKKHKETNFTEDTKTCDMAAL